MSKKKEILKKISNKEISHMREIDEKYQLDEDVLQLFMKTFYDFKELNKKEKEIKTKELVDKAKNKILEQREYKFLKDKSDGKLTKKEKFQYFEMKTEIKQLEQEMETFKYLKNQSINTKKMVGKAGRSKARRILNATNSDSRSPVPRLEGRVAASLYEWQFFLERLEGCECLLRDVQLDLIIVIALFEKSIKACFFLLLIFSFC